MRAAMRAKRRPLRDLFPTLRASASTFLCYARLNLSLFNPPPSSFGRLGSLPSAPRDLDTGPATGATDLFARESVLEGEFDSTFGVRTLGVDSHDFR
jgi:hypothetical protein